MFIHNFKYALITLFKNKMLIFWTFGFPILLATFFNMAFSDIENKEKFDAIDIAVVNNKAFEENEIYKQTFEALSDKDNEDRIFNTSYVSEAKAKEMLEEDEIVGYLLLEDVPKVVVNTSGTNETILKQVIDEISQNESMIEDLANAEINNEMSLGNTSIDYDKVYSDVIGMVQAGEADIKNISSSNLSYTMIEFYTLIAMTCLYGGILGMVAINKNLANMSSNGKRIAVSPTTKGGVILSSVCASYIAQLVGIALLFAYTVFVLNVDYGDRFLQIIILALVGCLAGLAMGIAIATLLKASESVKTTVVISVTMLGCFLSGMMGITMKYVVDKNVPFINKINPASMITDGFYALYYYETLDRYYFDIISLLIFAFVMILVSVFSLRRQKYDSI